MTDRRLTPANDRVMADHLPEDGSGRARVAARRMVISEPVVDLLRSPDGPRERQVLWGEAVDLYETRGQQSFVQSVKDGYVGYLRTSAIAPFVQEATHTVCAPATHLYEAPDLKSADLVHLSFGARLVVEAQSGEFFQTPHGFVPVQHVQPVGAFQSDPVAVATRFLGAPYLWGGNSILGIDCSGLVEAACLACGLDCPGDSDLQEASLGRALPAATLPERGDLLFWQGHVAWVASADTILHANAHSMSTCYEPLKDAIRRIADAGEGPVTSHKRI